ncbi:hypothetical protein E3N88_06919 [Mikania micrantha]|uniref:Uncharacterized protein n=1 Tax=Mikania micrantha TaxID=192012 RepID=A0A5N6PQ18_9ASTR|nr:hypothetical protein E3N88_06919 [Mikania micrantha]
MSSSTFKRWLRPEVYPLFAALGVAVGICGMQLVRNISGNPEVRFGKKAHLSALERASPGKAQLLCCTEPERPGTPCAPLTTLARVREKYAEHSLRKFVRNKSPEIMPNLNSFFADPK